MNEIMKQIGASVALAAQKAEITDQEAVKTKKLQKKWKPNEHVVAGDKRQYNDLLYKCRQEHDTQVGWEPDVYKAGWELIDEEHAGTQEDPIPYGSGMQLYSGKYYTEDGKLYLCNRDTGQAVYNKLAELVGLYVEAVEG